MSGRQWRTVGWAVLAFTGAALASLSIYFNQGW